MMGAFSQYERAMIVAKLKGARQRARAAKPGYREGRKVFGHLGGEPETIKRILKLRKDGLAYDTIAERLNADSKYPARKGKWHPTSVARVVQRHGP
jgi:DNA invertase Pin-like site-specific DNA recombinase